MLHFAAQQKGTSRKNLRTGNALPNTTISMPKREPQQV